MNELNVDTVNRLVGLGTAAAVPQMAPGANVPYVLVPEGYKAQPMPELIFNDFEKPPKRVVGTVNVLDPVSFAEYFNLFKDAQSRVFADEQALKVTAVLDYHNSGKPSDPRWCQHRLVLALRSSEEWKVWSGSNNKKFTQGEFAEFLEQHAIDITVPSPAAMMEVARDLQATTEVEFGSAMRNNDGQVRFKYTETTKASVGASQLAVPEDFAIELPVFVGGQDITVQALLRFRVNSGKLCIWYTLVRPEEAVRNAFAAARDEIAEKLQLVIINGAPA